MKYRIIIVLLSCLPLLAHADRMRMPRNMPPAFVEECGSSCHIAFPPVLLQAQDWRKVMSALDNHYGDNASLDSQTRREIEQFLVDNAGNASRYATDYTNDAQVLPRLTSTRWFVRKHHEVPRDAWQHVEIKSAANCAACHKRAEAGSYREREIVMPAGIRWEDD